MPKKKRLNLVTKKRKRVQKPSPVEDKFLAQVKDAGLPEPIREYRFHEPDEGKKKRLWRADFAWLLEKILVEVEGGVWGSGKRCWRCKQRAPGRHNSPTGFEADCEKYGWAVAQGWDVLRVTSKMVKNGLGLDLLTRLFEQKQEAYA